MATAACGGSSTAAHTTSTNAASTSDTLDPGRIVLPTPGVTTTVPTERGGTRPIDPVVDAGQQILITSGGFVPHQLFANVTLPVVWTNLTGSSQQIVFDYLPSHLPVIPPRARLVWRPSTAVEIAYRSTSGFQGVLTLQPGGLG
jgi:hypothetical protein